ncbi:putative isoleucine--tRNA ligase,cytoplasmic [Trichinella pseudospiralis]
MPVTCSHNFEAFCTISYWSAVGFHFRKKATLVNFFPNHVQSGGFKTIFGNNVRLLTLSESASFSLAHALNSLESVSLAGVCQLER